MLAVCEAAAGQDRAQDLINRGRPGAEARALSDAAAGWAAKDDPGPLQAPYTALALADWHRRNGDRAAAAAWLDRVDGPDARADADQRRRAARLRAAIAEDTDAIRSAGSR